MKALKYEGVGNRLSIAELPTPTAEPGGLVFRVKACGICASDLHAAEVGLVPPGTVFGHEYVGEVAEVGAGVSGWNVGDRLTALPGKPCGECEQCKSGKPMMCGAGIPQGFDPRMDGAYADYSTCMAQLAMKLPDTLSDTDAVVIEPLVVGLNAWKMAAPPAGASVLILGAGIIGTAVAKWARFFGAAQIGISELVPARIDRAKHARIADLVIDGKLYENPVAEFARQTGSAPTYIFECVGRPLIARMIEIAAPSTTLVMVGTGMQPDSFTVLSAAMKRLSMLFPIAYEPADFPFVMQMLARGRINADGLVTGAVNLNDAPAMFEALGKPNDHCKVLITP